MRVRLAILLMSAPLLLGAVLFGGARVTLFEIQKDGSDLVISWQSDQEDGVREYELHRMTPYSNGEYVALETVRAHGPGKVYRYRDDQVYKNAADMIDYRLDVVFTDGSRQVGVKTGRVDYTSTAVRRTWGSIKAMFQ
ncbi:MAG TPA: hypothetical protein VF190_01215 [Rhodothermales bacterium]